MFRPALSFLFLLILFAVPCAIHAQSSIWGQAEKARSGMGNKTPWKQWKESVRNWGLSDVYNRSFSLGFAYTTNGWNAEARYLLRKKERHTFSLGLSELMHEKETRIMQEQSAYYAIGKRTPFIFGKINKVYLLQVGYGRETVLLPGLWKGSMSVGIRYGAGASLGIAKPYYIQYIHTSAIDPSQQYTEEIRYSEATETQFLNRSNILGASRWAKGLGASTFHPGIYGSFSLFLEPDKPQFFIKRLLLGCNLNYHISPLPIMAHQRHTGQHSYAYIGLELGKRWRR